MTLTRDPRRWSLAAQLLALQLVVVVLLLGAGSAAAYLQAADASEDRAAQVSLRVASTVAEMPAVVAALDDRHPERTLQPLAERVRKRTGTDFVVVMSPAGIRFSHPNPRRIGHEFIGTIAPAAAGGTVVETYTGTLGPSVRAVVPVRSGGQVVALVSVGITEQHVGHVLATRLPIMAAVLAAVLVLGAAGTWLVTRRVRRQTRGLEPAQLRDMHDYHDAVLHSVREGLIVVDVDERLHLVNDEATRLLGLGPEDVGRRVDELDLPPELVAALASGSPQHDELHLVGPRILVLNQTRTRWEGRDLGTVATLRDRTELEALTGELDRVRSLSDALRSQHHEAMNRLHTIVSLIELGHTEQAMAFAVEELQLAQQLTDQVVASVSEPALAALLLGKAAEASELGIAMEVESDGGLPAGLFPGRDLVTIVGNLIDNAFDATSARSNDDRPRQVWVRLAAEPGQARIRVRDSGDGPPADRSVMFTRGWSTKQGEGDRGRGLGLALVQQTVQRLHGTVEVSDEQGAVFEVVLPTTGVPAEPAATPEPASATTAAPAAAPAYEEGADDASGSRR